MIFAKLQKVYGALFGLSLMVTAQFAQTVSSQLTSNSPVERDIAESQTHSYRINAKAGDFVRVVIAQKNADVKLRAFSPDGQKFYEIDNTDNRGEPERSSFIADAAGEFRLEIIYVSRLAGKTDGKDYEIKLEAVRPAAEKDKTRIKAERLYDQANQLRFEAKVESRRAALKIFQEAATLFAQVADRFGEAFVYHALGELNSLLTELPAARENHVKAAAIFQELNARPQLARAITDQAAVYFFEDDLAKSAELCAKALKIFQELGDRRGEAEIIGNLGTIYEKRDEPRKALEYYLRALPLLEAEKDERQQSRILSNLGSVYDDLGEPNHALEYYERALVLRRKLGDARTEAYTLANMSVALKNLGEYGRAVETNHRALQIFSELGEKYGIAACLNNLGTLYNELNDNRQALEFYEKGIVISRELKMASREAATLSNIANIEMQNGNDQRALELLAESLRLFREAKDKRGAARALVKLGETWSKIGNREKALEYLRQALPPLREIEDREWEGQTLFLMGSLDWQNNDLQQAKDSCQRSLQIRQEIGERLGAATASLCLARVEYRLRNYAESQKQIENAIEIVEDLRTKVSRQDLRTSYFSSKLDFYDFYIDLLVERNKLEPKKGFDALALQISERARARSLLESLGESSADVRAGIAPELLAGEKLLRQTINAKEAQRLNAVRQKNSAKAAEFEKQIGELVRQYRDAQAEIRAKSPQFAALINPEPLTLADIRAQVLDENSVLLEYSLGAERSFLFAATKTNLEIYELPTREIIERSAKQTIEKLKSANAPAAETDLADLSRILLAPVADKIQNKRLLIVAPGVLQYVPFAALASPKSKVESPKSNEKDSGLRTQDSGLFLVETNEIVNLPSASILALLRRNKTRPTSAKNLVAILADPVFTADDTRLKLLTKQKNNADLANGSTAVMREVKILPPQLRSDFGRLRFSRLEADAILALARKNQKFVAMDFAANLKAATGEDLQKSSIVHLATHGIINSDYPELSGVVLSLVDENGKPQDGFLRLHDVYNLRLDARLVVLSACETALGKEIKGEGIVGLTRGFMYAGSPTVAASLWKVDDRATADLMRRFYQKMLKDNLRPADALRQAQISMLNEKPTQNPFFWAAFTIQGEYK